MECHSLLNVQPAIQTAPSPPSQTAAPAGQLRPSSAASRPLTPLGLDRASTVFRKHLFNLRHKMEEQMQYFRGSSRGDQGTRFEDELEEEVETGFLHCPGI